LGLNQREANHEITRTRNHEKTQKFYYLKYSSQAQNEATLPGSDHKGISRLEGAKEKRALAQPASRFDRSRAANVLQSSGILEILPIILEGQQVRLEPLTQAHAEPLLAAASDGELWNSTVTIVPSRDTIRDYIQAALDGFAQGRELPFVTICKAADQIVGTTRFYEIRPNDRAVAIGYTWLAKSAQRTAVNTESKLLLLTHAFEHWRCNRVELITDVLNAQSRTAILRLGAKQEGILRKHLILPTGRIRDSVLFSIIDEEWPEVKARLTERTAESEGH
jgi:RimJ/RimL family protein N-acetyltransferase